MHDDSRSEVPVKLDDDYSGLYSDWYYDSGLDYDFLEADDWADGLRWALSRLFWKLKQLLKRNRTP